MKMTKMVRKLSRVQVVKVEGTASDLFNIAKWCGGALSRNDDHINLPKRRHTKQLAFTRCVAFVGSDSILLFEDGTYAILDQEHVDVKFEVDG